MGNRIAKLSSIFALSVALTTALLNTFFLGYMHQKVLPSVTSEVSVLLEREVCNLDCAIFIYQMSLWVLPALFVLFFFLKLICTELSSFSRGAEQCNDMRWYISHSSTTCINIWTLPCLLVQAQSRTYFVLISLPGVIPTGYHQYWNCKPSHSTL